MKKNVTFAKYALLCAISVGMSSTVFTSCKDYDDDINKLQTEIDKVAKDLADLKALIGDNPVKSVTYDEATGTLTVTPATGAAVSYKTHQTIPTYDIKLEGNVLMVNGEKKGEVTIKDASKVEVKEGVLYIDGVKTGITVPTAVEPGSKVEVKEGVLYIDGEATTIKVPPVVEVKDGALYINNVKQALELGLPKNAIAFVKNDKDEVISVTLTQDGEEVSIPVVLTATYPLAGLAYIPELIESGVNYVDFYHIMQTIDGKTVSVLGSKTNVSYRMNPTASSTENVTWSFLNRNATITKAAGDNSDLITILNNPTVGSGDVAFDVIANHSAEAKDGKADIFALVATYPKDAQKPKGEKTVVVSDYVQAKHNTITTVHIGDITKYIKDATGLATYDYETILANAKEFTPATINHEIEYTTKGFNLKDYVVSSADFKSARYTLNQLGFYGYSYKFTKVKYVGEDNITDQQDFVSLNDGNVTILQGRAAINRTPIFMVELQNAQNLTIATAYIKFKITDVKPVEKEPYVIEITENTPIPYADLYKNKTLDINWVRMNQAYTALGLSHEQFIAKYTSPTLESTVTTGTLTGEANKPGVDTYALSLNIDPKTTFGEHTWTANYTSAEGVQKVKVVYRFTILKPAAAVLSDIYAPNKTAITKGKMVGSTYQMQMTLKEAFKNYMADFNTNVANVFGSHAQHQFFFNQVTAPTDAEIKAIPAGGNYLTQEIMLTTPLNTAARTYPVIFTSTYENGQTVSTEFNVQFKNPFTMTINNMSLETLKTATTVDIMKNVVLVMDGLTLYDGSKVSPWNADASKYGVTANTFDFDLIKTAVTGNRLTIDGSIITWDNLGATLQSDITSEKAVVSVATDYATITQQAGITIQKSK